MARQMRGGALWAALMLAAAMPAAAEKIALVIGAIDYSEMADSPAAGRVLATASALEAAGISTTVSANDSLAEVRQMLPSFLQMSNASDGQVIVLAGKFANDGVETFFLPADAPAPSLLNLYRRGLPLSLFVSILHNAPEGGVLVLAPAGVLPTSGPNWAWSLGPLDVPANVAIVAGSTREVAGYVQNVLTRPRTPMNAGLRDLTVVGTLPEAPFLTPGESAGSEALAWDLARGLNTADAYRSYLAQHPAGAHVGEARRRLTALSVPTPQDVEASLALTRDQKRGVQRQLTVLGFDTQGIDGVFGAATRAAIRAWQTAEGLRASGFLTAPQLTRLETQAADRRAEIRRADQAYWTLTGASGTEAGLTAYLERYPRGIHADTAEAQLARFEAARRAEDRAAWDTAQAADTLAAYQRYLEAYPEGAFAEAAQDRIADLEARRAARAAAQAEEAALNLTSFARVLVERRLVQLGQTPGAVDGSFDGDTRRAIRQVQREAELPVTGYLNEPTLTVLLAGGLRDLLDR